MLVQNPAVRQKIFTIPMNIFLVTRLVLYNCTTFWNNFIFVSLGPRGIHKHLQYLSPQVKTDIREYDGAGFWSSFTVEVGDPAQVERVLISTASRQTLIVLSEGCPGSYGNNCHFSRGNIFDIEKSISWLSTNTSIYQPCLEANLGYNVSANGLFGFDTVSLGNGPQLQFQLVGGVATPEFWLGLFGLDPSPTNFSDFGTPRPSFSATLVDELIIPSTALGYTAEAYYRYDKVPGSLTLGGYDGSRFSFKNLSFSMLEGPGQRFVVELNFITYLASGVSTVTTPTTLLSESLSMFVDSTIPYLYHPTNICGRFETEFGLQWDSVSEIYTVNDTMHSSLQTLSPNVSFNLSDSVGETLEFILLYRSFDLTASFPVIPNSTNATNYFPLKRANDSTQYTLGRVFLQEAYLIVGLA